MNNIFATLEPKELWSNFGRLNAIPRPSKKEKKVIEFIQAFGNTLSLVTSVDSAGNVLIRKPASKDMENRTPIILQSHLDMVHQKNADTVFDFDAEGIKMFIDADWVRAEGTTLGADNGIGVAAIMTILASKSISHPALEALFTIDEETGMTGALSLEPGFLNGKILLNLDTEEDNELTIGCAGGIDITATGFYDSIPFVAGSAFTIKLKGLAGGHSGVDIHKGKANANKLMNRTLSEISKQIYLGISFIDGGSLRNAIPRESVAGIVVESNNENKLKQILSAIGENFKTEYHFTDPNLTLTIEPADLPKSLLPEKFQSEFLNVLYACPNGIYRLSPEITGLVQSSNNVARVLVKDGIYSVQCLTRSSVDSEKKDLSNAITAVFELLNGTVTYGGNYPGWEPKPGAPIVKLMREIYFELFDEEPHVNAVHAGLECGIIGTNYPELQMISFGPNIYGAHSPDEKVQVSSVQKFWTYLLETLKRIPEKD